MLLLEISVNIILFVSSIIMSIATNVFGRIERRIESFLENHEERMKRKEYEDYIRLHVRGQRFIWAIASKECYDMYKVSGLYRNPSGDWYYIAGPDSALQFLSYLLTEKISC